MKKILSLIFIISILCSALLCSVFSYLSYKDEYVKVDGEYVGYYKKSKYLRMIVIKGNDSYYEVEEPIYAKYYGEYENFDLIKVDKDFEIIQEFEELVELLPFYLLTRNSEYIDFIKDTKNQNLIINEPSFIITQRRYIKKIKHNPIEKIKLKTEKQKDKQVKIKKNKYEIKEVYN